MSQTLTYNVGEAKTHLSQLVALAEQGQDVVIARDGHPTVRLVPVEPKMREFGFLKLDIPDEALFAPMTPEEISEWEDGPVFPEDY